MAHQEEALKAYIGLLRTASRLEQVAKRCSLLWLKYYRVFCTGIALP